MNLAHDKQYVLAGDLFKSQIQEVCMKPANQNPGPPKSTNTLDEIKKLEQKREERRLKMEQMKKEKEERKAINLERGKNVDIDFELMIDKNRFPDKMLQPHTSSTAVKLSVCVRKRPIFKKEQQGGEIDAISCANPQIKIHQPKYKVDGISKYIENHEFTFDNTFNEEEGNEDIYKFSLKPLLPSLIQEGIVTCFAYGQTGSGKTFTMAGIQELVVQELYEMIGKKYEVTVSFFEIYGGRCYDLLNAKAPLTILEDKNSNIQINGLTERSAESAKDLFAIMQQGNSIRTTHATVANDTSSRSHSICQVIVRGSGESIVGKLVLVDLAGSERAQDTQSNNRQRRIEGAEINKSLLALKECIRAMDDKADHVPFRASKLTLVLRDSFTNKKCKVLMIACISPGSSSADHSLNTLRYADRLKDRSGIKGLTEVEQIKGRSESIEEQPLPKTNSSNNLRKDQPKGQITPPASNQPKPQIPISKPAKAESKPVAPPKQVKKPEPKQQRSGSLSKKEAVNKSMSKEPQKQPSNASNDASRQQKEEVQEDIQSELIQKNKNKAKDDVRVMKETMKYDKKQEFFDFHAKVTNILDEQEEIFATHMTAIKEDAKLLNAQSELISMVQGVGFIDYDIDAYVDKLETVIRKKLKIYNLLAKKVQTFKKNLKQEDEIRHKVKDTFYY